jgi:hypothetical protein
MTSDALTEWLAGIERAGRLTPEEVVEHARDPDCPGHGFFEWDDSKAAHKHRLDQARELLAKRVVIKSETYTVTVPRYLRDPDASPGVQSYVSVRMVSVEGLQHQALAQEFARVGQMLARARELAKAFGLAEEVEGLMTQLQIVQKRLPPPAAQM